MRLFNDGDIKLATFVSKSDIAEGLKFYSEDSDFVQVGTWSYDKGKRLADHIHNIVDREVNRTQEVIYVIRGSAKAFIYSEDEKLFAETLVKEGDFIIFWNGGHGYEILEDDTLVLEVKNGPFLGVEKDKRRINK